MANHLVGANFLGAGRCQGSGRRSFPSDPATSGI